MNHLVLNIVLAAAVSIASPVAGAVVFMVNAALDYKFS